MIRDIYTREEKEKVKEAIRQFDGAVTSISKIAKKAGLNPNRTRFIIDFLEMDCEIVKEPAIKFNERYVRYMYKVVE